jgi:hypothetical protein
MAPWFGQLYKLKLSPKQWASLLFKKGYLNLDQLEKSDALLFGKIRQSKWEDDVIQDLIKQGYIGTQYDAGAGERYITNWLIGAKKGWGFQKTTLKKADGGYISGPGTPTSDSIPARLSNGEYVIRASAVSQYGTSFLDKVNEKRFALGGLANSQKFNVPSIGGNYRIGASNADNSSFNDNSVYNINVSVDTNANPDDIASAVMTKIQRQQQTMTTKRVMGGIR